MKAFATLIEAFQDAVLKNDPQTGDQLAVSRDDFSGQDQMRAYIADYRLRLQAVVEADYPATRHYLGGKAHALVHDFVEATPSRSTNINHYPLGFAAFLHGKADGFADALAQFESTISQVYQAPDSPALTTEWLKTQPADYLLTHALQPRHALTLLSLPQDAESYFSAFRHGETAPITSPEPVYLAICRHENHVRRHRLSALAFALLSLLAAGEPLLLAIESLSLTPENESELESKLQEWLATWIAAGFFRQP